MIYRRVIAQDPLEVTVRPRNMHLDKERRAEVTHDI